MAIFTRVYGDAQGVNVMDTGDLAGNVIALGLTKAPTCWKVSCTPNIGMAGAVNPGIDAGELSTGGAVETILRAIAQDSTVVLYQVENTAATVTGNLCVMVEATGANASTMQTRLRALTNSTGSGNLGISANIWAGNLTVTDTGFVLK